MISQDLLGQLRQLLRPLATRVANSIARAVVQVVDDDAKLQLLQVGVLAGEDIDDAERFQQYGFSSFPLPGSEAVVLFPNGDRAHPLVVAVDDRRYRPVGAEPGEVVLYSDEGDQVRLARGNVIVLETSGEIRLGSDAAGHGVIKGNERDTAEQNFLTALNTFAGATLAPTAAKSTFSAAVTMFKAAATAAVSTKVKAE